MFKKIQADQRGSILPVFAVTVVLIFMVASFAVDFARQTLASEKLKIATEAAATAAAMSAKRYVRLEIDPGDMTVVICDEESCYTVCESCGGPFVVEGREDDLLDRRGYTRYCCDCGCGKEPEILERWVEYENNGAEARAAAELFFNLNRPEEMSEGEGGRSQLTSVQVFNNKTDPRYPSVIVRATGTIKTKMLDFMDRMYPGSSLSELSTNRCSQGGTFYYDLNGRWHRAAQSVEGCE